MSFFRASSFFGGHTESGVKILAEVDPNGSLNYDEIVVYNNDAIRPSYLVMYEEL